MGERAEDAATAETFLYREALYAAVKVAIKAGAPKDDVEFLVRVLVGKEEFPGFLAQGVFLLEAKYRDVAIMTPEGVSI